MSENYRDMEREKVPQAERLRQACEFASTCFGNSILRGELKEAAEVFAERLREDYRKAAKTETETKTDGEHPLTWKQVDARTFAVQSDALQMTEAGLRLAMYQIPKQLRKDLLKFRWTKRYRDTEGKQWLEFEAA